MAQYARPDSDVSSGSWSPSTGSTLYECIDEETPSDADYIESDTDEDECEVGLSTVTDPESSSNHTVRWRWQSTGSSPPTETCSVYLYEGATLRATCALEREVDRGGFAAESYTLAGGEADAISDYSALRVRFHINRTGSNEDIQVSWVELEVPDAGGPAAASNLMLLGVG
jgi:hypothetical protein